MTNNVFVYGSLKMGHGNSGLLSSAKFLGEHITPAEYTMLDLGAFPGVVLDGDTPINGEVYKVDESTMQSLDWLEGYPEFYNRKQIDTPYGKAWMYYLADEREYPEQQIVRSGTW